MKSGPKPAPTRLKLLRGNPGNRPLPKNEPQPEVGIPDQPSEMSDDAQKYWDQYATELNAMKVLTQADFQALALLCEATATFWNCMDVVRKQGVVVKVGKNSDYVTRNPFLTEANAAQKQMMSLLTEFGLTPSSRTRVQTTDAGATGNRFA